MITSNLPAWSKGQIEGYIKTGELEGGEKIPQSSAELKPDAEQFIAGHDAFVASDNNPEYDSDPRPGFVAGTEDYLGRFTGQIEKSADGKTVETTRHFPDGPEGNEAVWYTKSTPESFDQVVVTKNNGSDDSAVHYTPNDQSGSFFIFKP